MLKETLIKFIFKEEVFIAGQWKKPSNKKYKVNQLPQLDSSIIRKRNIEILSKKLKWEAIIQISNKQKVFLLKQNPQTLLKLQLPKKKNLLK